MRRSADAGERHASHLIGARPVGLDPGVGWLDRDGVARRGSRALHVIRERGRRRAESACNDRERNPETRMDTHKHL